MLQLFGVALVGAIVGTAIMVRQGLLRYLHPDFQGVPMWLPSLYLWAAAMGAQCDRFLNENIAVKKPRSGSRSVRGTPTQVGVTGF